MIEPMLPCHVLPHSDITALASTRSKPHSCHLFHNARLARFCVQSEDKVRLEKVCFHVGKHCGDKDKIMKNANI